jgi:hypothetical protein
VYTLLRVVCVELLLLLLVLIQLLLSVLHQLFMRPWPENLCAEATLRKPPRMFYLHLMHIFTQIEIVLEQERSLPFVVEGIDRRLLKF